MTAERQRHEDHEHRREHGPALPRVANHLAERVAERRRDQQDREHLEKVRERRRVLERMRGVRVEEPAAVRAELLDRDLARGRTERHRLLRDDLRAASPARRPHRRRLARRIGDGHLDRDGIEQLHGAIRREALHDALRHQHDGQHERQRQQDIERAAREVDLEVADPVGLAPREPADQRDEHGHAVAADRKFCTARPSICVR